MKKFISISIFCFLASFSFAQFQQGDKVTLSLIGGSDVNSFNSALVKGEAAFNLSPVFQLVPGFTWSTTQPFQRNSDITYSPLFSSNMTAYGSIKSEKSREDYTSFDLKLKADLFRLLQLKTTQHSFSVGFVPSLYFYRNQSYSSFLSSDGYTHIITGFSSSEGTGVTTYLTLEYNYRISSAFGVGVTFDNPLFNISGNNKGVSSIGLRINYFIR